MKISLKYKLLLVVFSVLLIYAAVLLYYSRYFADYNAASIMKDYQASLNEKSGQIAGHIALLYPNLPEITVYINSIASQENLNLTMYDTSGSELINITQNATGARSKTIEPIKINGQIVYFVEIDYPNVLINLLHIYLNSNISYFALLLTVLMILALTVYFHATIVKPLTTLQSSFNKIGSGSTGYNHGLERNDEIGDLYRKFNEMVQRLDSAYRQQLEIISSISHDIKTPLTSIIGYMERLSGGNVKSEEKVRDYYRIIQQKAHDIKQLTDDFTDYTENETDCLAIAKEKVYIYKFFNSLCHEFQEDLEPFDIKFECFANLNKNTCMEADINKIRRVFANLINNSLKYSNTSTAIKISAQIKSGQVIFVVEDNGPGVPADELNAIFNAFYRIDKSRSREKGGRGLGLAICRRIIESHGGTINAYNLKNGGLEVVFSLPVI